MILFLFAAIDSSLVAQRKLKRLTVPSEQIWSHGLHPRFEPTLDLLGDRLKEPGKERIVLEGTLTRRGASGEKVSDVRVTWEFPGLVRMDESAGSGPVSTVFDGDRTWKKGGTLNSKDIDLIETLAEDSAEYLMLCQLLGGWAQFLKTDTITSTKAKGTKEKETLYEVYEVFNQLPFTHAFQQGRRLYYVNEQTRLLEFVRYKRAQGGMRWGVEVQLAGWEKLQGESFPRRITRREGTETAIFEFDSVSVSGKKDDDTFK
jgi:hypothetical protein